MRLRRNRIAPPPIAMGVKPSPTTASGASLPLAAIDRSFAIGSNGSTVAPSVPAGSHVWTTHTSAAGQTWWFVLAISVEQPWELLRSDLYPVLPLSEQVVVYDYRDPAGTAKLIEANQTVLWEIQTPPAADGYHGFTYLVIAAVNQI